jgi:uncharacterized protein YxjI
MKYVYLKQKVFAIRDTFKVFDEQQTLLYEAKGKILTLNSRRDLFQSEETKPMLTMKQKILALSFVKDNENHEYPFTVTRYRNLEKLDLYQDLVLVLQERFGKNNFETDSPENLSMQFTFDTLSIDIWVLILSLSKFEDFFSFSTSFYLGFSNQNV